MRTTDDRITVGEAGKEARFTACGSLQDVFHCLPQFSDDAEVEVTVNGRVTIAGRCSDVRKHFTDKFVEREAV